jgi:hypothetical protein
MKNLQQIFVLTEADQRVIVVMMIVLLVVTFAERYRHAHMQIAPLTSRSATTASDIDEAQVTTDERP